MDGVSREYLGRGQEWPTRVRGETAGLGYCFSLVSTPGGVGGGVTGANLVERGETAREAKHMKAVRTRTKGVGAREGTSKSENKVEEEEPQIATVHRRCKTARHRLEDPPGCWGAHPETGPTPVCSWATPKGTWRAGVCRVLLQLGRRAVRFPCGQGRHVIDACCVMKTLARSAAPAPPCFPAVNCGAQHGGRNELEAAVQVALGLRNRAARIIGGAPGCENIRNHGLRYGWDQASLHVGTPHDVFSLDDLRKRFGTGKKCRRAHARLSIHVLRTPKHTMGEHQPNFKLATPNSLLPATTLP